MLASPEFKRGVVARIIKARSDGVSAGKIAKACNGLSIHIIYDALSATMFPKEIWEMLDEALKSVGY